MPVWYKKVDRQLFFETYEEFLRGEISLGNAAKKIGLSIPTVTTRFDALIKGEKAPDDWFFGDEKEKKDKKPRKRKKGG